MSDRIPLTPLIDIGWPSADRDIDDRPDRTTEENYKLGVTWRGPGEIPTLDAILAQQDALEARRKATEVFNAAIAAGYSPPDQKFTMGLTNENRANYDAIAMLIERNLSAKKMTEDSPFAIPDAAGKWHAMTLGTARELLLDYGNYAMSLFAAR